MRLSTNNTERATKFANEVTKSTKLAAKKKVEVAMSKEQFTKSANLSANTKEYLTKFKETITKTTNLVTMCVK